MDNNKIQELLNNLFPQMLRLQEALINERENEAYNILVNNDTLCAFWLGLILTTSDDRIETIVSGLQVEVENLTNQVNNLSNIITNNSITLFDNELQSNCTYISNNGTLEVYQKIDS